MERESRSFGPPDQLKLTRHNWQGPVVEVPGGRKPRWELIAGLANYFIIHDRAA